MSCPNADPATCCSCRRNGPCCHCPPGTPIETVEAHMGPMAPPRRRDPQWYHDMYREQEGDPPPTTILGLQRETIAALAIGALSCGAAAELGAPLYAALPIGLTVSLVVAAAFDARNRMRK